MRSATPAGVGCASRNGHWAEPVPCSHGPDTAQALFITFFLKMFIRLNFLKIQLIFQNSHKFIEKSKSKNKFLWNPCEYILVLGSTKSSFVH
jgi:hypothetical protein